MTTNDAFASGNIPGSMNLTTDVQGLGANISSSDPLLQSSVPMGAGLNFESSAGGMQQTTTTTTTTTSTYNSSRDTAGLGGAVMGVGGGVGDSAQDVTYSTKNNAGLALGTSGEGQTTTTTTTTTQYG